MASIHPIRKDGKTVAYRVHWREDGMQRSRQFRRKADADSHYFDVVKNGGRGLLTTRETVQDFANRWLDWAEANREKATVQRDYMPHLNQRIIPMLGKRRLSALSSKVRDEWIAKMVDERRPDGKRVHSNNTINATMKVMNSMLNRAVRWEALTANPFAGWERLPVEEAEIVVPTLEQVDVLMAAMPTPTDRAIVAVAAFSGPRRGEVMALQWADMQPPALRVWRALGGKDGKITKLPKNGSRRTTCLLPFVVEELRAHAVFAGIDPQPDEWVFRSTTGTPLDADNWAERVWRPVRAGIADRCEQWLVASGVSARAARRQADAWRSIKFHWLRHFFVSMCASRGAPERIAQEWSGHKDDRMWAHYRHMFNEDHDAAVAALHESIGQWRKHEITATAAHFM